jgi:hypothetical protein
VGERYTPFFLCYGIVLTNVRERRNIKGGSPIRFILPGEEGYVAPEPEPEASEGEKEKEKASPATDTDEEVEEDATPEMPRIPLVLALRAYRFAERMFGVG